MDREDGGVTGHVRDVMRFTVVDPRGRVSFIAPCATLEALVAACASDSQPRTLEQLLKAAEPFVGDLGQRVLSGLAVFDEPVE